MENLPVLRGRDRRAGAGDASRAPPPREYVRAADCICRRTGEPGRRSGTQAVRAGDPVAAAPEPSVERTLILVKPDAFARGLTGEIVARFERKGLRLEALRQMTISRELASRHAAEQE